MDLDRWARTAVDGDARLISCGSPKGTISPKVDNSREHLPGSSH
jgi:hypothetical protein